MAAQSASGTGTWTTVAEVLSDGLPIRAYLAMREGKLSGLSLQDDEHPRSEEDFVWSLGRDFNWVRSQEGLMPAAEQVAEYFSGRRQSFGLPLHRRGSAFQQRVWRSLEQIPYGETMSYGEVAELIGHPGAFRAVGTANGRNAIGLVVPCHRVVAAGGKLGGYGSGLGLKLRLLAHEAAVCGRRCTFHF